MRFLTAIRTIVPATGTANSPGGKSLPQLRSGSFPFTRPRAATPPGLFAVPVADYFVDAVLFPYFALLSNIFYGNKDDIPCRRMLLGRRAFPENDRRRGRNHRRLCQQHAGIPFVSGSMYRKYRCR